MKSSLLALFLLLFPSSNTIDLFFTHGVCAADLDEIRPWDSVRDQTVLSVCRLRVIHPQVEEHEEHAQNENPDGHVERSAG
jgi:hypothetical protein